MRRLLGVQFEGVSRHTAERTVVTDLSEGHRIEDQVVADLKKAGFFIEEVDPITGKQYEFKEFGGHVVGCRRPHIVRR